MTLRVLTWHVHGSYLYYLSQTPVEFILPVKEGRPEGYGGRSGPFPWPRNVVEVPADSVRDLDFDCVLFQSRKNWLEDQHAILSAAQLRLPRIYLEHDPPLEHPASTKHLVDDPNVLLVHVTPFNDLMWDPGTTPTRVIDHGVIVPDAVRYTGDIARGISVVNNLGRRGRRLGPDVFDRARRQVPLDLVGINSLELGGLGEVPHDALPALQARYRFFFNPIRYTSMGLAVCEAMMLGMPIVGLATTEMATAIDDGRSGFVDTNVDRLIDCMHELLHDPALAHALGREAQRTARGRFNISRFAADWLRAFEDVTGRRTSQALSYPTAAAGGN